VVDAARRLDKVYLTARYPNGFVSGTPSDYFTEKEVYTPAIPTDTLVYSETDFVRLRDDPESFVSQNLPSALEL